MSSITINAFGGSIPRMEPHLLPASASERALDCKLTSGALASWRELLHVRGLQEGTQMAVRIGDCWHEYTVPVEVAYGSTTCSEVYITGLDAFPVVVDVRGPDCTPYVRRLGVPCGGDPPTVMPGAENGAAAKDIESRTYAYQYVDALGNRGALSRASNPILVKDGQTVAVTGWDIPAPEWDVVAVRIFRAVSSVGSSMPTIANTMQNPMSTTWMFVEEVALAAPVVTDSRKNEELDTAAEEDVVVPPPPNLRGIVHVGAMNCLAGFVGNRVYFSENNHYHNWPHYMDLDDNVCALAENNGIVYAATDGHPYAIRALADCDNAACRQAVRLPVAYPMVGCGNLAMTTLPQGVVYPSHRGLVMLSDTSVPALITHSLYSEDDWQALVPQSITSAFYGGKLFVFGEGGAFAVSLRGTGEDGWQMDSHTELSDTGAKAVTTRQGDLYLIKNDALWQWDRGATLRPHEWRSAEYVTNTEVNFGAGHVRVTGGPEYVDVEVDGRPALTRTVLTSRQFRLPNWAVGTRWHVTLRGTGKVVLASLATSMKELRA